MQGERSRLVAESVILHVCPLSQLPLVPSYLLIIEMRTKKKAILCHFLPSSSVLYDWSLGKDKEAFKGAQSQCVPPQHLSCLAQGYITVDLVRSYCHTMMFAPWESQKYFLIWSKSKLIKNPFTMPCVYSFIRVIILGGANFALMSQCKCHWGVVFLWLQIGLIKQLEFFLASVTWLMGGC